MTELKRWTFEGQEVRTVVGPDGEPWWLAVDVCRILEHTNVTMALQGLEDDEKMTLSNADGHSGQRGGPQSFNIVSEAGLYSLILGSRKPEAKRFKRWVTHEVLPSIRKTGTYTIGDHPTDAISAIGQALMAISGQLQQQSERQTAIENVIRDHDLQLSVVQQSRPRKRSHEDKRRVAAEILSIDGNADLSDMAIAAKVDVSAPFVAKIRRRLESCGLISPRPVRRDVNGRPFDTARFNRSVVNGVLDTN